MSVRRQREIRRELELAEKYARQCMDKWIEQPWNVLHPMNFNFQMKRRKFFLQNLLKVQMKDFNTHM